MTEPARYPALGVQLRSAREAASLTQQWVAMRLGVEQGLVSLYERGVVRPRPERLAMYAAVLGLDLAELRVLAGYPALPAARSTGRHAALWPTQV